MKDLFGKIVKLITSIFSDLCSFRNKVTVFVCVLMTIVIIQNKGDSSVILAALGVLDSYLIYYLHNRKKHDPK